jgi:glycosyltransferase involved in cell wall biosynthesis
MKKKILFVNSYEMHSIWENCKKYNHPAHHLWGTWQLEQHDFDVDLMPCTEINNNTTYSLKLKTRAAYSAQIRLLARASRYDIIYSGNHLYTAPLAHLRYRGLLKQPLAAMVFSSFRPENKNALVSNQFINGYDKLLCINQVFKEHLKNDYNIPDEKLEVLEWGVDLPFYTINSNGLLYTSDNEQSPFILSAGKTCRDYDTLIEAFKEIDYPLKIYGYGQYNPLQVPPHIYVPEKRISWQEMLAEYQKAYAVAIPLNMAKCRGSYQAIGLTSLLEAMAMAKAVVMTRNNDVGIDIEKEGIGFFVKPGHRRGWKQTIDILLKDPEMTKKMGAKARSLAETRFNLGIFSRKLNKILTSLCNS